MKDSIDQLPQITKDPNRNTLVEPPKPEIHEKETRPILRVNDSMLMEITSKCYTGCEWCYKCDDVNTKGEAVSLDLIRRRLSWVKDFTDAEAVYFLGGEPLLHPQFREIVETANDMGLRVEIITSGRVSKLPHEQANRDYAIEQYQEGKMAIELSYQPGRNEKAFKSLFDRLVAATPTRRTNLERLKNEAAAENPPDNKLITMLENELSGSDLFTTVTFGEKVSENKELFSRAINFLLDTCNGYNLDSCTVTRNGGEIVTLEKHIGDMFQMLQQHFLPFEDSQVFFYNLNTSNLITHQIRLWGADRIIPITWEISNNKVFSMNQTQQAKGSETNNLICPAMNCSIDNNKKEISINTALIRTDGEVTFATPSCISVKTGLCNADTCQDVNSIFATASDAISLTKFVNVEAKAATASSDADRCKLDEKYPTTVEAHRKICPSCPVNISCQVCHAIRRPN